MRQKSNIKNHLFTFLLVLIALVGFAVILINLPGVQNLMEWRYIQASAYLRGVVDPVHPMPTAAAASAKVESPTPTLTPVPDTPTPTVIASPTPTASPTPLPEKVSLPSPKYEKQDANNCGPTTLALYMRMFGWDGTQHTISDELKPNIEDSNVNVEELIFYARNHAGWLNSEFRVGGNIDLLRKLLGAGVPVMIEESMTLDKNGWPNDDRWAGHYLLVTGYDDTVKSFISQDSWRGADRAVTYEELDRNWKSFNRVYILLYRPEQEPAIKNILGDEWDMDVSRKHAQEIAEKETQDNPQDAYAWFNLGSNLTYFEQYDDAAVAYDKARDLGLPQRMLRYQFGPFISYFHSGRIEDLMALTDYALKRTPNSEEAMLWRGWGLYRQGKKNEAAELYQKALQVHPGYQDAEYALKFLQAN